MANSLPALSPRLFAALGTEAPVVQSGMRGVAGPELVAAVSNAGGLGVLAALHAEPDLVRASIRQVRELTDKPFGVNIWLHEDVRSSPNPEAIPDDVVRAAQSALNELRPRFELEPTLQRPEAVPDLVDAALEVMIEERIPVFSAGVGLPEEALVSRFHSAGSKVVAMVATVADGEEAVGNGVDVVVAQGTESGGHRSYGSKLTKSEALGSSTLTLMTEMIDAVGAAVPVLAAGGIIDGRGLAAMLALGGDGVLLGTRFVATKESTAAQMWKKRLTSGERQTTLTDGFTGQWARVLRSEFTSHWDAAKVEALPGLLQAAAGRDLFTAAKQLDDDQMQPLYAGAGVGSLEGIPGAGQVIDQMVAEARACLARLSQ